ncbi:RICIN domain-containing protein [Streptomyces sp. CA-111067]|uniref:RICIN domain-containing protein n=1 Tax=Streptomyces sp. CA-111067 TaxID=3240046 RepID=UPI003D996404
MNPQGHQPEQDRHRRKRFRALRVPRGRSRRTLLSVSALATGALLATTALTAAGAPTATAAGTAVQVYFSSESRAAGFGPSNANWFSDPATGLAATPYQLSKQADLSTTAASGTPTITADTGTRYQSVLGVGSSLEESTIYNLSRMSPAVRTAALHKLVDPVNGAGFNIARIPLGTSDFTSRQFYTYDDGAADPGLSRFSIQKDIDYKIISVLKEAKAINPNLLLFGSVWSPPAWMKTNNSLLGGSLPDSNIGVLATYLRKAVTAYAGQGLPLYAVTMQNEPLFNPSDYPGMTLSADQERRVAVDLRGELNANGAADTKIWAFDHNFSDGASYTAGVIGSPGAPSDAYNAVDGIAFHDYGGDPSAMSQVKASYPAKTVGMTERAVWGTAGADRIVQYFRNQSIMYEDWVTMLDQNRGPEQWSGSPDPSMLIQSAGSPDTYWALPDYNIIAQFSKFVARGATRVQTNNGGSGSVTNVAFMNPDGTLVTVVVNQTGSDQPFTLRAGSQQISSTLPAKTVGTYLWPGATSGGGSTTGPVDSTKWYTVKNANSGKCVDDSAGSTTNGAAVQQWSCVAGSTNQQWQFQPTDSGYYKVVSRNAASAAWDVTGGSGAGNGAKIQLWSYGGGTNQQWKPVAGSNGTYTLTPRSSPGSCLDVTDVSTADAARLQQWTCTGGPAQSFTLTAQ